MSKWPAIIALACGLILYSSCADGGKSAPTEAERIEEIERLMADMFKYSSSPDMRAESDSVAALLKERYDAFVAKYPEHEVAPMYLDQAANIARKDKDYPAVLDYYQRIVKDYPDYENIVQVKFLIAFVYDTELNDKEKARSHYQAVASEHPEHNFGKNAKARLENLHMSDQELMEHFQEKNKATE